MTKEKPSKAVKEKIAAKTRVKTQTVAAKKETTKKTTENSTAKKKPSNTKLKKPATVKGKAKVLSATKSSKEETATKKPAPKKAQKKFDEADMPARITKELSSEEKKLQSKIKPAFDVKAATKHVAAADRKIGELISIVGPCRLELMAMHNCFETLMESIVYQQLTGKAAATILGRVKGLYGNKFPTPKQLLKTSDDDLRGQGLSRAKTAALKDLAEKTTLGILPDIEKLESMDDDEIIRVLSSVRGIGEWTVQMLLIFRLGRPDVIPTNDYGVRKGYAKTYKMPELPTPKDLLKRTEKWKPYRTIGAWYMWRSLELK